MHFTYRRSSLVDTAEKAMIVEGQPPFCLGQFGIPDPGEVCCVESPIPVP
jgi:hypothetical protein